ncbi:MAG: pyruvate ferredoxin oxidoreductase [Clostridia bacterium BRH_c25]|nr:MAG: pyruvate ferredoxin oxidoreductase [Clostridia bacterium BRH_c25]
MAYNFKEEMNKPERLMGGHRMCAGCGGPVAARGVMRALKAEDKAVVGCATGCMEVSTFMYPYTAWKDSFIHNAFENVGATVSGAEAAYKAMKRKGKIDGEYKFIAFGGDGGTYDIGFQSLSGAMERGHDMVYVCYDNGAYMNTGTQRSSATPRFADTTTTPAGTVSNGKPQGRKDLTQVIAAHHIPYVAQTTFIKNFKDLHEKSEKALYKSGAAFLNILSPCPRGWRYPEENLMELCNLAVETCYWPLFEVEDGVWKLNYMPKKKLPIEDFLKPQGRFKHLFEGGNEHLIAEFQDEVDNRWNQLLDRCEVK